MMENDECGLDTARCGIDIIAGLCSTHALHGPVAEWDIRHSLTLQRRDAGYGMDTLARKEVRRWVVYLSASRKSAINVETRRSHDASMGDMLMEKQSESIFGNVGNVRTSG